MTERRTRRDWAHFMRDVAAHYPDAERIVVVLDNLNTHGPASFYEAFPAEEAHTLARRFAFHHTPPHGSWLNVAEIELSVLGRQCLDRRLPDRDALAAEAPPGPLPVTPSRSPLIGALPPRMRALKLKRLYPSL